MSEFEPYVDAILVEYGDFSGSSFLMCCQADLNHRACFQYRYLKI